MGYTESVPLIKCVKFAANTGGYFLTACQWRNNRACKACSARGPSAVGAQNLPTLFFLSFFWGRGVPLGILARGPTATLLRHCSVCVLFVGRQVNEGRVETATRCDQRACRSDTRTASGVGSGSQSALTAAGDGARQVLHRQVQPLHRRHPSVSHTYTPAYF